MWRCSGCSPGCARPTRILANIPCRTCACGFRQEAGRVARRRWSPARNRQQVALLEVVLGAGRPPGTSVGRGDGAAASASSTHPAPSSSRVVEGMDGLLPGRSSRSRLPPRPEIAIRNAHALANVRCTVRLDRAAVRAPLRELCHGAPLGIVTGTPAGMARNATGAPPRGAGRRPGTAMGTSSRSSASADRHVRPPRPIVSTASAPHPAGQRTSRSWVFGDSGLSRQVWRWEGRLGRNDPVPFICQHRRCLGCHRSSEGRWAWAT
jgi:hypothetical protein